MEKSLNWKDVSTVHELWNYSHDRIKTLIAALDLNKPELKYVKQFIERGDTVKGAETLVEYFRNCDRSWVVQYTKGVNDIKIANLLCSDSVIFQERVHKIPENEDGGWKWNYNGEEKDDEIGYTLNGLRYLKTLLTAWKLTDEEKYVRTFDKIIKDWTIHHRLPGPESPIYDVLDTTKSLDWRDIGEVEWRTIQAGQRLGEVWPQVFFGFQEEDKFTPASRLLILSSINEQAGYLQKYHKSGHNWTTMEMNGLALAGLAFPEFNDSEMWTDYALKVMSTEINRQVYPDGVQKELSTKTQFVAVNRFESLADNFQKVNRPVAEFYIKKIESMYNYLAYSLRPDGHQPLNNDSDREDLRPIILNAAKKFNRPDWEWIATNGNKGEIPKIGPTITFPWAGIHFMRNGWDNDAHWSIFDTGPYGTGHQHRDKLHLSISAFGKDLLVDGGRYTHENYFSFDPTIWRGYFRSSFSHNVILVDGKGQNPSPEKAQTALIENIDYVHNSRYDYAFGTFNSGYEDVKGKAIHSRQVLYIHNKYWLVLDNFETDRPRDLQILWHYSPDCNIKIEENKIVPANKNDSNLIILPTNNIEWQTEIIKGQETPYIQGWYSETYGKKVPNSTIVYSAKISKSSVFAWLLIPVEKNIPKTNFQFKELNDAVNFSIEQDSQKAVNITLPKKKKTGKVRVLF